MLFSPDLTLPRLALDCTDQPRDLTDVLRYVKFTLASVEIHISHFPKHITLFPALVVKTCYGPRTTHVPVGVATIQLIFVVQVDCYPE